MRAAILVLMLAGAACSSPGPERIAGNPDTDVSVRFSASSSTVSVSNPTADALEVRAYPEFRPPLPQVLGGDLHLAYVPGGSSVCIEVPDSAMVSTTNVTTGQVQTIVWTSSQQLAVTVVDTAAQLQRGQTSDFTPSASPGWTVTLPGATPGVAVAPAIAARCRA